MTQFFLGHTLTPGNADLDVMPQFIPAGGRTVPSFTQYQANQSVYNVLDYGATGDGLTDDAAAIQLCVNACPAYGTVLFPVPSARYLIGASITLPRAVTLLGGAYGVPIKAKTASALTQMFVATDIDDIAVRWLAFDGNATAKNVIAFVATTRNPSGLTVERCVFTNTAVDPTLNFGAIRVYSSAGSGGGFRSKNIIVQNNRFYALGTEASICAYSDNIRVLDNDLDTTPQHGFGHVTCTRIVVSRNTIKNCTVSAIEIGAASSFFTVSDNDISNCGGDGAITIEFTSTYGTVDNNRILDCNTPGVSVAFGVQALNVAPNNETVKHVAVTNNVIRAKVGAAAATIGINVYSSTAPYIGHNIDISNNVIEGFPVGVDAHYLTQSRVAHNRISQPSGASSVAIRCTFVTYSDVIGNLSDAATTDHAIQLLTYAGQQCDYVTVADNTIFLAGAAGVKAMVRIEGTGNFRVSGNKTGGATGFVSCAGNAVLVVDSNMGQIFGTAVTGAGTPVILHQFANWVTFPYTLNGAQVLGLRKTGWSTATGVAARTAFDTTTVTLPALAQAVKALIDDLHATPGGHGLIGS